MILCRNPFTHKINLACKSQKWWLGNVLLNFSLKYVYIILQTRYENTQTYQEEVVILIQHQ